MLLHSGQHLWEQFHHYHAHIRALRCSSLHLRSIDSQLLFVLCGIDFNSLLSLTIFQCSIESIELLPRIRMPQLKIIYLNNNSIVSTKPFRKANLQRLT